ncbi:MAG TPA: ABC transporter ATP-binding protein [Rhizomicrobium sp.]|jgi:lipopolysaccharide transport system ATP-binding protein|nr:ABC transporter ATP-binding protein [Rhizomicrobium sp.]
MSSEPVVEARGLGKAYAIYRRPGDRLKQLLWGRWRRHYEEFWAVRNVDIGVRRGESVAIVGANGSGKSTLLQMICGTLRPTEGEVRLRGRVAAMLALGSGFNPEFTGRENVHVGASVLGLGAEETAARFEAIAAFADIGAFMDQPLKRYSSGMHARLAFALCANVDADVLVIDEILSVGDAAFQQKCMRFLNRFRLKGTLLFVSHDSGAVAKLCDRALWLERGEVRGLGSAKEINRLYLAAQAEERAEDQARFEIGGRSRSAAALSPADTPAPVASNEPIDGPAQLVFEAEDPPREIGGAQIQTAAFCAADGEKLQVAGGGEVVEIRIDVQAHRDIADVVFAFVVRDRLGQIIFSDDTSLCASHRLAAGESAVAKFRFLLPYLANGAYALESFVFERAAGATVLLHHRAEKQFLYVQSPHPSNGLANIAMRAVALRAVAARGEQSVPPADARLEMAGS